MRPSPDRYCYRNTWKESWRPDWWQMLIGCRPLVGRLRRHLQRRRWGRPDRQRPSPVTGAYFFTNEKSGDVLALHLALGIIYRVIPVYIAVHLLIIMSYSARSQSVLAQQAYNIGRVDKRPQKRMVGSCLRCRIVFPRVQPPALLNGRQFKCKQDSTLDHTHKVNSVGIICLIRMVQVNHSKTTAKTIVPTRV